MAIQNFDGPSGDMGGIIYYNRNGKKCMRMRPAHYTDAKTTPQLKHREKISKAARFTKACRKFIDIGYQATDKEVPVNEARSFMIKNCFTEAEPLPILDYSKMLVSRGIIVPPKDAVMVVEGSSVTITWDPTHIKHIFTAATDRVMVLMFTDDCKAGTGHYFRNVAFRGDGKVTIPIPKSTAPLHTWMFFHEPDVATGEHRAKISNSVYLGEIESK